MKLIPRACLVRQAIFNARLEVCGYELLYGFPAPIPTSKSSEQALSAETGMSASTLTAALTDIGLDSLVGSREAWVNVGDSFLTDDLAAVLPADRAIIEVLETTSARAPVIEAVARLRGEGYRIALDDFVYREGLEPLIELADVIKIDVRAHDLRSLAREAELAARYDVVLLAEKVETHEELERCRELGFRLFQGYFLSKPRLFSNARTSTEVTTRMQLVAQMNQPEVSFARLAQMISTDVTLSYRLLRYINSAYLGLRRPVSSLREALVALGIRRVRSWAMLLLLADSGVDRHELVVTALVRARMCENLAEMLAQDADEAFLAGLLSVVDALTDRPIADVIPELPIESRLSAALLEYEGRLGDLLKRVLAFEQGEFAAAGSAPLDALIVTSAYMEALAWTTRLTGTATGPDDHVSFDLGLAG